MAARTLASSSITNTRGAPIESTMARSHRAYHRRCGQPARREQRACSPVRWRTRLPTCGRVTRPHAGRRPASRCA
jgi:hypothetical protein